MKMSDVFVLSSKYEGLPNVLQEAAYLNKYIISSNCKTGPREILNKYNLLMNNYFGPHGPSSNSSNSK